MNQTNKLLIALGSIALGSTAVPGSASAQQADVDYDDMCAWLSQQSATGLQDFIRDNLDSPCVEVAAQLLAEKSQPAAGVRASTFGRY